MMIGLLLISVAAFAQSYSKGFTMVYTSVGIQEIGKDSEFRYDHSIKSEVVISGKNIGIFVEGISPLKFTQVTERVRGTQSGYAYQAITARSEGGVMCRILLFDDEQIGLMLMSDSYNLILFNIKYK